MDKYDDSPHPMTLTQPGKVVVSQAELKRRPSVDSNYEFLPVFSSDRVKYEDDIQYDIPVVKDLPVTSSDGYELPDIAVPKGKKSKQKKKGKPIYINANKPETRAIKPHTSQLQNSQPKSSQAQSSQPKGSHPQSSHPQSFKPQRGEVASHGNEALKSEAGRSMILPSVGKVRNEDKTHANKQTKSEKGPLKNPAHSGLNPATSSSNISSQVSLNPAPPAPPPPPPSASSTDESYGFAAARKKLVQNMGGTAAAKNTPVLTVDGKKK